MKNALTSPSNAVKPSGFPNGLVFFVIILTIAVTLVNSSAFIYSTLASYFLYTSGIAALILLTGILILRKNGFEPISFTLPAMLFIGWTFYMLINGWLKDSINLSHLYFFFNGAFFLLIYKFGDFVKENSARFFYSLGILSVIEAIICLLQFSGYLSSMNRYFTATGTWSNPNVTAMFMAMAVPPVVALIVHTKRNRKAAIFILLMIVIGLLLLKCRTAFIGAAAGTFVVLNFRFHFIKHLFSKFDYTKVILAVFCLIVIASIGWNLYNSKKDSADGRKLVWRLSLEMVKEKPITGYGYGLFERDYNLYQANYFSKADQDQQDLKTAGHVNMGYNEPLQNAVEGGLIGFALFLSLMFALLFIPKPKSVINHRKADPHHEMLYAGVYAGIVTFGMMSLVNFTIQAVPVMAVFIVYSAVLVTHSSFKRYCILNVSASLFKAHTAKWLVGLSVIISGIYLLNSQTILIHANLQNKKAALLGESQQYTLAMALLKPLEVSLSSYESYWKNYGEMLYADQQYTQAITMLDKAKKYSSNPVIYKLSALCFEKMNEKAKALENYKQAAALEPSRMGPKYDLMQCYISAGAKGDALLMAKYIITIEPKMSNSKSIYYKKQAARLLLDNGIKPSPVSQFYYNQ